MMPTWKGVLAWLRQPTTIAGIATLAGDLVLIATGAASWRIELPIAAGSLVAMAIPDNAIAASLMAKAVRDILTAIATRDPAVIMAAVADAEALLAALDGAAGPAGAKPAG